MITRIQVTWLLLLFESSQINAMCIEEGESSLGEGCVNYIKCYEGHPLIKRCEQGYSYNQLTKTCEKGEGKDCIITKRIVREKIGDEILINKGTELSTLRLTSESTDWPIIDVSDIRTVQNTGQEMILANHYLSKTNNPISRTGTKLTSLLKQTKTTEDNDLTGIGGQDRIVKKWSLLEDAIDGNYRTGTTDGPGLSERERSLLKKTTEGRKEYLTRSGGPGKAETEWPLLKETSENIHWTGTGEPGKTGTKWPFLKETTEGNFWTGTDGSSKTGTEWPKQLETTESNYWTASVGPDVMGTNWPNLDMTVTEWSYKRMITQGNYWTGTDTATESEWPISISTSKRSPVRSTEFSSHSTSVLDTSTESTETNYIYTDVATSVDGPSTNSGLLTKEPTKIPVTRSPTTDKPQNTSSTTTELITTLSASTNSSAKSVMTTKTTKVPVTKSVNSTTTNEPKTLMTTKPTTKLPASTNSTKSEVTTKTTKVPVTKPMNSTTTDEPKTLKTTTQTTKLPSSTKHSTKPVLTIASTRRTHYFEGSTQSEYLSSTNDGTSPQTNSYSDYDDYYHPDWEKWSPTTYFLHSNNSSHKNSSASIFLSIKIRLIVTLWCMAMISIVK